VERKRKNTITETQTGLARGNAVTDDGACSSHAATRDHLCSRRPLEDSRTTREPPTAPWRTKRDPYALNQGVTSLARAGHPPSVKNQDGRGWKLLDQKRPVTTVESHVPWKNWLE
jgi:hypothetical protein